MGHRIGMVATGGTISMRREVEGKAPAPALGGAHLVAMLDEGAHVADVEVTMYEPHRIPSEDLSFSLLSNLARTIEQALTENDSVIVTHGTNALCIESVLTGKDEQWILDHVDTRGNCQIRMLSGNRQDGFTAQDACRDPLKWRMDSPAP